MFYRYCVLTKDQVQLCVIVGFCHLLLAVILVLFVCMSVSIQEVGDQDYNYNLSLAVSFIKNHLYHSVQFSL